MNNFHQGPHGAGRGRGRGRGRGADAASSNMMATPWNIRGMAGQQKREKEIPLKPDSKKSRSENGSKEDDNWKGRETASESRLEKAKQIRKQAAEKFSHLLEDSESSDEELRDEEIMRKTMNSYKNQFHDDDHDLPEPSQSMTDLLQSGETTCPVCIDPVKHMDAVWSCIKCYGIFHIQCIQRWARQAVGAQKVAMDDVQPEGDLIWCCPNCRHEYQQTECPTKYICFCGKQEDPKFDPWAIPHSCGTECAKELTPNCGHECLLLCHPGPCPPCPKTLKIKCHCGRGGPTIRRCSKKEWSCGSKCGKLLACGHHTCKESCHPGECPSCPEKSVQPCICLKSKELRDCAEPIWKCSKVCGKVLPCGNHTCEEVCHSGTCGACPRTAKRSCPCGKMSLQLPCTEDIPPCEDTCGKLLECGRHYCHRQCHNGPCETCRQIVNKTCRCGKRSKEIPCCQIFTCDFKCTRIRNCQRHPCKRKCCDGDCPICEQTCNRSLSCKNHKCPSQCHTGLCFPCPLKKDVKCFCGQTSISVKCGAERCTKPPRCKQACQIPSSCHHDQRDYHRCHFNRCPQCKQTCDKNLQSCDHKCPERCHDEIPVRKPDKPNMTIDKKPRDLVEFIAVRCPPCKVPLQRECFGKHEISTLACSQDRPYSCKRNCGRRLPCGNHQCERECHIVDDALNKDEAGKDCYMCEEPCLKPRPNGCSHVCKRPCHPGDCPPCLKYVRVKCHCGLIMMEVKCHLLTDELEQNSEVKSCKNRCPKMLKCGHRCSAVCHPGDCPEPDECKQKVKLYCPCKRLKKEQRCHLISSGDATLECDEKCKEILNEKRKEEEALEAAKKAEELKKQQDELEWFKRKTQGRKRKQKQVIVAEKESFIKRHKFLILCSSFSAIIAILAFFLFSR